MNIEHESFTAENSCGFLFFIYNVLKMNKCIVNVLYMMYTLTIKNKKTLAKEFFPHEINQIHHHFVKCLHPI